MYSDKEFEKIIANICSLEYKNFFCKANVIGVGLGYRICNGIKTSQKVIKVLVRKKLSKCNLSQNDIIPTYYKGIKTDVEERGTIIMKGLTERIRPVTGGYSIGPAGIAISGTYGALVSDGNNLFILSNNHILALNNKAPHNQPILQPSAEDGGSSPNDVIAHLSKFIPIRFKTPSISPPNFVDCAIARVAGPNIVSPSITFEGIPKGIMPPSLNLLITAACRTSGLIFGSISTTNLTIDITTLTGEEAIFRNQIELDCITAHGDSGALVLGPDRMAVGLLFCGSDSHSYCNPIATVLINLNVSLVTE